jgi:hypothetical protein
MINKKLAKFQCQSIIALFKATKQKNKDVSD